MQEQELDLLAEKVATIVVRKMKTYEREQLRKSNVSEMAAESEVYMNSSEAADFLGVSNSTLYKYTQRAIVPYSKPAGRDLVFKKSELVKFLESKSCKDSRDLDSLADDYCINR